MNDDELSLARRAWWVSAEKDAERLAEAVRTYLPGLRRVVENSPNPENHSGAELLAALDAHEERVSKPGEAP